MTFSRPTSFAKLTIRVGDQPRMLDRRGVVRDDARDQDLARRQLHLLPHAPFVLVAHIGGLDRIGAGLHLQDQVDDVLERRVGDVRHVPAAEADVIADAVLRDAFERVVERLDAQLGPFAIASAGSAATRWSYMLASTASSTCSTKPALVDLEIFLAQRLGDGEHIVALAGVVLVDARHSRRSRARPR